MKPRLRILCMADLTLAPEAVHVMREVADVDVLPPDDKTLRDCIGDYDAFWGHLHTKVDAAVLERGKRLKFVATASTGTDHIDKVKARELGIEVLSITNDMDLIERFTGTAELGWVLLLMVTRRLRDLIEQVNQPAWSTDRVIGQSALSEMTLGVVGVGRLGTMSCRYGNAFCRRVLGCDRKPFQIDGVERVDFDTLLRESDAITLHVHMTPENHQLINARTIAKMKDGATLINTSRGDLIDESALLAALESGKLAGFGADVLHNEWRENMAEHPVVVYARTHHNVVITPHVGGAVITGIREARMRTAHKLAAALRAYMSAD